MLLKINVLEGGGSPTSYGTTPSHQLWDGFDKNCQLIDNFCSPFVDNKCHPMDNGCPPVGLGSPTVNGR